MRTAGDEAFDAVETLLASPVEGWPVLIVASSATDKSRVAKLLADRPDALVAMFHPPDVKSVTEAVRAMADAAGVRLTGELAERIARGAGWTRAWRAARSRSSRSTSTPAPRPRAPPTPPRSMRSAR